MFLALWRKKKKICYSLTDLFNCLATHLFIQVVLQSPFPPSLPPLSFIMNPRQGFKGQLCVFGSTEWLIYPECKYQSLLLHHTHTHTWLLKHTDMLLFPSVLGKQTQGCVSIQERAERRIERGREESGEGEMLQYLQSWGSSLVACARLQPGEDVILAKLFEFHLWNLHS